MRASERNKRERYPEFVLADLSETTSLHRALHARSVNIHIYIGSPVSSVSFRREGRARRFVAIRSAPKRSTKGSNTKRINETRRACFVARKELRDRFRPGALSLARIRLQRRGAARRARYGGVYTAVAKCKSRVYFLPPTAFPFLPPATRATDIIYNCVKFASPEFAACIFAKSAQNTGN